MSESDLEDLRDEKVKLFKTFLAAEPPKDNGESLLALWGEIYDETIRNVVLETVNGNSNEDSNRVYPYEKLVSIVGDGGNWKWPRMWQRFDELERRGPAYRQGEELNFGMPNKNPEIKPLRVLVVGGGPVGMRMSIEMAMAGHFVSQFEKRREVRDADGELTALGFTNRINRPHMWPFVRNDLGRLNGKDFMSREACYPVFTEPETSSVGIDELQLLLLKNALLVGVDFRLGVGYDDAKVATDPKSHRPFWKVEVTADALAAKTYGMPEGKQELHFDCLIGCDGPRSAVRSTQEKHFGSIEKRKFMDCVGIVANVRKVPRKRLKDLGFAYGQEPSDMNRSKMKFKDFFEKINTEANADLESLIYYKASFHNYVILTPKRQNLIDNGLSGRVYHFAAARGQQEKDGSKNTEKQKLKEYSRKVIVAAGIPVDPDAPNEGFVDPPNDCMAFDFAECWNTSKSLTFNLPPADYDTALHGAWMGKRVIPLVALAGDSLLEPFWPMGLGLKRGWQAIMDTCYAVDNLYNKASFTKKLGKLADDITWDEHYDCLKEQVEINFENCNRLKVAEDLGKGEYNEKGNVILQLKKINKDCEKPIFEVEVDPWTRYAPLAQEKEAEYKAMPRAEQEKWMHPVVKKALAKQEWYQENSKGGKSGEIDYKPRKIVTINGKVIGGAAGGYKPPVRQQAAPPAATAPPGGMINTAEVARVATERRESLTATIMAQNIDALVQNKSAAIHNDAISAAERAAEESGSGAKPRTLDRQRSKSLRGDQPPIVPPMAGAQKLPIFACGMPPSASARSTVAGHGANDDEMALSAPQGDGIAAQSQAMWDRMQEKHLSPSQNAELIHVRGMIDTLTKSLEAYRQAERDLLLGTAPK
jgi:flavin-dependent dehydrogenase